MASRGALPMTLPETKRIIDRRGYGRLKGYFYAACAELADFLLLSPQHFASLHKDGSPEISKSRTKRIKILKTAANIFAFSAVLAALLFLPWKEFGAAKIFFGIFIVMLSYFSALMFFGVMFHALNNFIEDLPSIIYGESVFTEREYRSIENFFNEARDYNLEPAAEKLYLKRGEISALFTASGSFRSKALKDDLLYFIETLYASSFEKNEKRAQSYLDILISGFIKNIDSLNIQDTVEKSLRRDKNFKSTKYHMLVYFFQHNDKFFAENASDGANKARRIEIQKRFINLLFENIRMLRGYERNIFDDVFIKARYSRAVEQLYVDEYLRVLRKAPSKYFISYFLERGKEYAQEIRPDECWPQIFFLSDLSSLGAAGIADMVSIRVDPDYYKTSGNINNEDRTAESRLYSLFALSRNEYNLSFFQMLDKEKNITYDSYLGKCETGRQLIDISVKFLKDIKETGFDTKNDYFNSFYIELIYTALAVIVNASKTKENLMYTLYQFKYVFSNGKTAEVTGIFNAVNSKKSESHTVPVDNIEECISILEKLARKCCKSVSRDIRLRPELAAFIKRARFLMDKRRFLDNPSKKR